jgi:hypothetical protein
MAHIDIYISRLFILADATEYQLGLRSYAPSLTF